MSDDVFVITDYCNERPVYFIYCTKEQLTYDHNRNTHNYVHYVYSPRERWRTVLFGNYLSLCTLENLPVHLTVHIYTCVGVHIRTTAYLGSRETTRVQEVVILCRYFISSLKMEGSILMNMNMNMNVYTWARIRTRKRTQTRPPQPTQTCTRTRIRTETW
jgi:hypothetical protein